MRRYQQRTRKERLWYNQPLLWAGLIAATIGYALWHNAQTINPAVALKRAESALADDKLDEAESLLSIAVEEPSLTSWAEIVYARLNERKGDFAAAKKHFLQVEKNSAASLDARIGLMRLGEADAGSESGIELDLVRASRQDLLPELYYLQGMRAERTGEATLADAAFQRARMEFPKSSFAKSAREEQSRLRESFSDVFHPLSLASLLAEAKLLLEENEPLLALETVQQARELAGERTPGQMEAQVLEEKVLRKLKRNEEADHLLLLISADGGEGIADEALLKIARNTWNINDHHRALEFIDKLKERFPKSPLLEEAKYIEARILEEIDMLPEARDIYLELSKTTNDDLNRIRALKRVAWLYLRKESYAESAKYFHQAKTLAQAKLAEDHPGKDSEKVSAKEPTNEQLREVRDDYEHCYFWEGFSLSKLDAGAQEELTYQAEDFQKVYQTLAQSDYCEYYCELARKELRKRETTADNFSPPAGTDADKAICTTELPESFGEELKLLSSAGLFDLSEHEIDWFFAQGLLPAAIVNIENGTPKVEPSQIKLEELVPAVTKARLYLDYAHPKRGIGLAESLTNRFKMLGLKPEALSAPVRACLENLNYTRFPTPYSEYFRIAAERTHLPLNLLYAIARTESHFDPAAESRVGAQGLMQLMPETAKEEGLQDGESLLSPETNIALGAAHLAGLLNTYSDNEVYAVAAYNAGKSAVNRWRSRYSNLEPLAWSELIGYSETQRYVKKVLFASEVYKERL